MRFLHDGRYCAIVLALAAAVCAVPADAQTVRTLVQSSRLAGFVHDEAAAAFPELRLGERLELAREPDNPFDAAAIRVEWRGRKLGYVPRKENAALAEAMDRGAALGARVTRLRHHPNPRLRIEFDVYIE
jgi:hypothetical protein